MIADLLQGCRHADRPLQNTTLLDSNTPSSLISERHEAILGRHCFGLQTHATKRIGDLPHQIELSDACRHIVSADMTLLEAVRQLQDERALTLDAIRLLPHALPKRVAVWWGCLVVWKSGQHEVDEQSQQTLQEVVAWVLSPCEEQRRTVEALAKQAELLSPATNLAMAVFLSGGSLTPPGLPVVEPKPWLAPQLVGAAVLMTIGSVKEATLHDRCHEAIHLGMKLAAGRNLWTADGGEK